MANAKFILGQTGGQIDVSTAAAPATPAAGYVTLYADTDKALYSINEDGVVTPLGTGVTGPQGPTGATGAAGATGPTGSNATSPITEEQSNSLVSTGVGATANVNNAVVIGATACAVGAGSIVIGLNAKNICSTGTNSVVIGTNACTNNGLDYGGHVVIGFGARAGYAGAGVAIGANSISNNGAVGILNTNVGEAAVSIGSSSRSLTYSVSIGSNTNAGGGYGACDGAVAIGFCSNNSTTIGSTVIGNQVCSSSNYTIGIGVLPRIFCGATGAIVLGNFSVGGTGACNSVVLGNSSQTLTPGSIVIGANAKDKSTTGGTLVGAIVIGNGACICEGNAYNGHIAIGRGAIAREQNSSVAIGDSALADNIGIAIGCFASASATASVAIGGQNSASGLYSTAIGRFAKATAQGAQAIGYDACSTVNYGNAIGWESRVCSSGTNGVAIGYQACVTHTCAVALGSNVCSTRANTTHVNSLVAYGQAAALAHSIGSTGGTATLNWDNSNIQTVTLTSSISSLTKSNPIDGAVYTVFVTQGGSGGYTVDWGADVKWAGGTGPTLSTAVGATDAVSLVYVAGITGYYGNANLNFA